MIKHQELAKNVIDPDVVEAACLAHDLGHPPFGHVAEKALDELSTGFGGFEGNAQSFRIIARLASRSSDYSGLDLTAATLAATLKYPWLRDDDLPKPKKWGAYESERQAFDFAASLLPSNGERSIEASIMDWADDITYSVHDAEDFYRANRLPLHLLAQADEHERDLFYDSVFRRRAADPEFDDAPLLKLKFREALLASFSIPDAYNGSSRHRAAIRTFSANLINRYINGARLLEKGGGDKVSFHIDAGLQLEVRMLKELTWTYVIEASSLAAQQHGQTQVVRKLYEFYSEAAISKQGMGIFPNFFKERIERNEDSNPERACIDLIASMTETQAVAMHQRLTGQSHGSGLDDILN